MKPTRAQKNAALSAVSEKRPLTDHERNVLATIPPDQLVHIPTADELVEATTKALDLFEIAGAAIEQTIEAKCRAGQMLAAKRASLGHGEWLPFLDTIVPPRYIEREANGIIKSASEAWHSEVRRWIKIANCFERFPSEALERAHTVRQILTLAQFIPEGGNEITGGHQPTPNPALIVARVEKWWTSQSGVLNRAEVSKWPRRDQADLAERLRPLAELYASLSAA